MARESILLEAERIVNGERNESYGDSTAMFQRIADLWLPILADCIRRDEFGNSTFDVEPRHVALCMIQLKVARETFRGKRDNRVDMAGYAELLDRIDTGEPAQEAIGAPKRVPSRSLRAKPVEFPIFGWYDKGTRAFLPDTYLDARFQARPNADNWVRARLERGPSSCPTRLDQGHWRPDTNTFRARPGLSILEGILDPWTLAVYVVPCEPGTDSGNAETDLSNREGKAERPEGEAAPEALLPGMLSSTVTNYSTAPADAFARANDLPRAGWWAPGLPRLYPSIHTAYRASEEHIGRGRPVFWVRVWPFDTLTNYPHYVRFMLHGRVEVYETDTPRSSLSSAAQDYIPVCLIAEDEAPEMEPGRAD